MKFSRRTNMNEKNSKIHISLNVEDINESVEFYQKMFAVEPMKHFVDYAKFNIANPPLNLVLNQADYKRGGSLSHLGIQVFSTEAVLEMREKWVKNNLLTLDEMQVDCCYAKQDKTWISDPDGNEWEVFVVLENIPPTEMNNAESSCCVPKPISIGKQTEKVQSCC